MTGTLYIISAPSGAGKTSLVKRLVSDVKQLAVSISHTTRPKRSTEQDGRDYHFVSLEQFEALLLSEAFLEYAKVFDNYYGTSKQSVIDQLSQGLDVILEIDWQGAQQVRHVFPDSESIFILPPSKDVLRTRLTSRGQDEPAVIEKRLFEAAQEMCHALEFDYLVVNDDFEFALNELCSIIKANRLRTVQQQNRLQTLLMQLTH